MNDIELARRLAHSLKGVSENIGANELHLAASDLETALKEGNSEAFDPLLNNLSACLNKVLDAISNMV